MTDSKRLSTDEAAAYCGVSASHLNKLRVLGGGPVYLKLTRRVAYDTADLDAWMTKGRRVSTSQPARVAA